MNASSNDTLAAAGDTPPLPSVTRLLPGALLPAGWLMGGLLQGQLPALRDALATGRLRLRALPLAEGTDWAHDRWLRGHPALAGQDMPGGAMAAARTMAAHATSAAQPSGMLPSGPDAAPCWLLQPITFRLTTDSMLVDTQARHLVDEALARRLVNAIEGLLADYGYRITLLTPLQWLLTPLPGQPGWQLQCTPLEAVGEVHVDERMPRGPDDRRFRRLLNEIQMTWHLMNLHEPYDLPVNGVWLSGPVHAASVEALQGLMQQGLLVDERFLAPRMAQDIGSWLERLPVLDDWLAQAPGDFSCLLAGEHALHWLHAPAAAARWQALVEGGVSGSTSGAGAGNAGKTGRAGRAGKADQSSGRLMESGAGAAGHGGADASSGRPGLWARFSDGIARLLTRPASGRGAAAGKSGAGRGVRHTGTDAHDAASTDALNPLFCDEA